MWRWIGEGEKWKQRALLETVAVVQPGEEGGWTRVGSQQGLLRDWERGREEEAEEGKQGGGREEGRKEGGRSGGGGQGREQGGAREYGGGGGSTGREVMQGSMQGGEEEHRISSYYRPGPRPSALHASSP